MPEISRFFGMVISRYHADHAPPHLHVRADNLTVRFDVERRAFLDHGLCPRARRMIVEWAGQHEATLATH
jgi:hypothetical protein